MLLHQVAMSAYPMCCRPYLVKSVAGKKLALRILRRPVRRPRSGVIMGQNTAARQRQRA